MSIDTETWGRDACELIDYDSKNLYKKSLEIKGNTFIYRCDNQIISSKKEIIDEQYELLIKINDNENNYEIIRNQFEKDENENIKSKNSAWFLLKQSKMSEKLGKYKIHQGEIIKIGRIVSRIREIRFEKKKNNNNNNKGINSSKISNSINNSKNNNYKLKDIDDNILLEKNFKLKKEYLEKINDMANQRNPTDADLKEKIQILSINNNNNKNKNINNISTQKTLTITTEHKKKDKLCRICYLEEEDEIENPIVQPCHCSGSCKYIHLNCLKQWINTKSCLKVDQNDYCSVFIFTEIECELCKAKLPDLVEHNGKLYSLLDFSDEFSNYLVLESLTLDKENNKFLYLI